MRLLAFLLAALPMSGQSSKALAAMRDHDRPLLVFEGSDAKRTAQQLAALAAHAVELRDRQVVLVGPQETKNGLPLATLSKREWHSTKRRFRVSPGEFTVILLGKDGGEKLRLHRPLSWDQLRDTIDAMPMRQAEMQSHLH